MAQVLKTQEDRPDDVVTPAGIAYAEGRGGVVVDQAVLTMSEFQQKDGAGALAYDEDGNTIPLEGRDLKAAVDAFAETYDLRVVNLKAEAIEALPQEVGQPSDAPISLEEGAAQEYVTRYGAAALDEDDQKVLDRQEAEKQKQAAQAVQGRDANPQSKGDN